ncbi:MAG TPA: hypothetical protein VGS20_13950 [Candidatus Acidoferrales bacterium]|nr:hypothetical protein [Candidatus Acidoferrales bacterium]
MARKELRFNIKDATPHTLPMARLAEYLKKLATVLGSEDRVHFLRMEEGSAPALIEIDEEIQPVVVSRTKNAERGQGPREAVEAYESLRDALREDGHTADLESEEGEVVTEFLPPAVVRTETFGPFWQEGTLDGLLTRIEGVDQTIHVTLIFEGARCIAETNREIGMQLGPRFYKLIRAFGKGKWFRNTEGKWELRKFIIRGFEEVDDVSLPDIVARLRAIPDNDLAKLDDPIGEMLKIRRGEE